MNSELEISNSKPNKRSTEWLWRIANALLWYLTLLLGCFSREAYDGLRKFAHVNPLDAWVNNPWFLPIALSLVIGRFVRHKGASRGLSGAVSFQEGLGFGLLALVAFSSLPFRLLAAPLPLGARVLYMGYLIKLAAFGYLVVVFTNYLLFGNDNAFFPSRKRESAPGDSLAPSGPQSSPSERG